MENWAHQSFKRVKELLSLFVHWGLTPDKATMLLGVTELSSLYKSCLLDGCVAPPPVIGGRPNCARVACTSFSFSLMTFCRANMILSSKTVGSRFFLPSPWNKFEFLEKFTPTIERNCNKRHNIISLEYVFFYCNAKIIYHWSWSEKETVQTCIPCCFLCTYVSLRFDHKKCPEFHSFHAVNTSKISETGNEKAPNLIGNVGPIWHKLFKKINNDTNLS